MSLNTKPRRGRPAEKSSKPFTFRLDLNILHSLEKLQEQTRLSKTAIIELALEDYFKKRLKV